MGWTFFLGSRRRYASGWWTAGRLDRRGIGRSCYGDGLSALSASLYGLGIPEDSILRYETALKIGKFVLIVHGSAEDTLHAKEILNPTNAESLVLHA